jgi:hypothetical protein
MITETRTQAHEDGSTIPGDSVGDSEGGLDQGLGGLSEEVFEEEDLEADLGGVASVAITILQVTTTPIKGMTMKITIKNLDFIIEQVPSGIQMAIYLSHNA